MLDFLQNRGDLRGVRIVGLIGILLGATVLRGLSSQAGDLTFVIPPNSTTTVNLTSTSGLGSPGQAPDETTATYAGYIEAQIVFDPESLEVTEFAYTGGYIERAEADPTLQIFPAITYTGVGTPLPTSFVRKSSSSQWPFYRGFTPVTVNPPASVDPFNGTVLGNHEWLTDVAYELTTGILAVNSAIVVQDSEVITSALPPVSNPHRGTPNISLTEIGSSTFTRNIRATLSYEFSETKNYSILQSAEQFSVSETGTWSTTANFTLPTDYSLWAQENGLNDPDPESTNHAGIPYVFLYNLDLPATTSSMPSSFVKQFGQHLVQITLPESGIKLPMSVEYSTSMENGSWQNLPFLYYLDGFAALDAGATGSPRFIFPSGPPCFMRFKTSL